MGLVLTELANRNFSAAKVEDWASSKERTAKHPASIIPFFIPLPTWQKSEQRTCLTPPTLGQAVIGPSFGHSFYNLLRRPGLGRKFKPFRSCAIYNNFLSTVSILL